MFFAAEAAECVAELESLLATKAEAARLRAPARRLRGSAHMASRDQTLRVALALEAVVRTAEEGGLAWDDATRGALASALGDLKAVADTESVATADAALATLAPLGAPTSGALAGGTDAAVEAEGDFGAFLRAEAERIAAAARAAAVAASMEAPDPAALRGLLDAQAALSGSSALADVPVVARCLQVADSLARALLTGEPGGEEFSAAFGQIATALEAFDDGAGEDQEAVLMRLDRAAAVALGAGDGEPEIPVEVVNFFRSEARAELARAKQLAGDAAEGRTATAVDRLKSALSSLSTTAVTFGFGAVGGRLDEAVGSIDVAQHGELPSLVAGLAAEVLDALGAEEPPAHAEADRPAPDRVDAAAAPIVTAGASEAPAPAPALADPEGAVPISDLCYSGARALRRAAQLRSAWEKADPVSARDIVEEVFDLIDLARA